MMHVYLIIITIAARNIVFFSLSKPKTQTNHYNASHNHNNHAVVHMLYNARNVLGCV